jgi:hypothetical protein
MSLLERYLIWRFVFGFIGFFVLFLIGAVWLRDWFETGLIVLILIVFFVALKLRRILTR